MEHDGVTIPDAITATEEQIEAAFEMYRNTTPLEPVDLKVYAPFARAVLLPLDIYIKKWTTLKEGIFSEEEYRHVYMTVLTKLLSRYPPLHEENQTQMQLSMRMLSPLPEEVFPNEYYRENYQIYLDYREKYKRYKTAEEDETLTLEEYADAFRVVNDIVDLYAVLLESERPDLTVNERGELRGRLDTAMHHEHRKYLQMEG